MPLKKRDDGSERTPSAYSTRVYTGDEAEFIAAMARLRARLRRVPTLLEGLAVAKELGWRKCDG